MQWIKATDRLPGAGKFVSMKFDDSETIWRGEILDELNAMNPEFYSKLLWRDDEFSTPLVQPLPSNIAEALEQANPYPEKVFPDYNDKQLAGIVRIINGEGYSSDRIFGAWGRKVYQNACAKLRELLSSHSQIDHEAEKEVIMKAFAEVHKMFEMRSWIMEGRGSYPYNDDRYKEEVRYLFDEFDTLYKDTWANIKSKSVDFRNKVIADYLSSQPDIISCYKKLCDIAGVPQILIDNPMLIISNPNLEDVKWAEKSIEKLEAQPSTGVNTDIEKFLLHLIDVTWKECSESESVPSTEWRKDILKKSGYPAVIESLDNTQTDKIKLIPIPEPIGNFILEHPTVKPRMLQDGAYYHYSKVCTLLKDVLKSRFNTGKGEEQEEKK